MFGIKQTWHIELDLHCFLSLRAAEVEDILAQIVLAWPITSELSHSIRSLASYGIYTVYEIYI